VSARADQDACATDFINKFGLKAFRRPVNPDEAQDLMDLYNAQRDAAIGADFQEAIRTVLAGILQSPYFLYHWELGQTPTKDGSLVKFNSYEMASRLSYFLWNSMPDTELFRAAGADELQDANNVSSQAQRLLQDSRSNDSIANFTMQWLEMDGVDGMTKDPVLFPNYNPNVGKSFVTEMADFVTNTANTTLDSWLTSTEASVDPGLAKLYGVQGVSGQKQVSLNPAERAGILTRGAFLASKANAGEGHPVYRGVAVMRSLLCIDIQKPANKEIPPLPERLSTQTTREHFSAHATDAFCASCHGTIDPIGFSFEHYDATGGYRTTDVGKPVDSTGSISLDGMDHQFNDAVEMSKAIAGSSDLRSCMAKQWLRYALGRREVAADPKMNSVGEDPSLKYMGDAFSGASYDIRTLLVAFTRTTAFTHRTPAPGEGL
jgi:hypothetical protein